MSSLIPIAFARGDGIGPEITEATLKILKELKLPLDFQEVHIGEKIFEAGIVDGIDPRAWEIILASRAFLKAPITTPQGGGFKSVNVTFRARLGLFANVRPARAFSPFVRTKHPDLDLVIIRENEEDLYCGIEYQSGTDVATSIKVITKERSERIIRYAFEYARAQGRKKVTCMTKDNIMKRTDGLFHRTFLEVGQEYPEIEKEHWIVDIGAAKLADTPENFDVVVLENLYGDILSDVTAQIAGSVGLAGSMNQGQNLAMFEAIHGSAPRRAGQNLANPSAMILGSCYMLDYLGLGDSATLIANALLTTLEDGLHTYDIFREGQSKKKLGTLEFSEAIIERVGKAPKILKPFHFGKKALQFNYMPPMRPPVDRALVGADLFFYIEGKKPQEIVNLLSKISADSLKCEAITNQGNPFYPQSAHTTLVTPEWRARFLSGQERITEDQILALAAKMAKFDSKIKFTSLQMLYLFDGKKSFSDI